MTHALSANTLDPVCGMITTQNTTRSARPSSFSSVRALLGCLSGLSVSHSKSIIYGALYEHAGHSTGKTAPPGSERLARSVHQRTRRRRDRRQQVRKTPSWPRSWANFNLLPLHSHRNAWDNLRMFWTNLTRFLLQWGRSRGRGHRSHEARGRLHRCTLATLAALFTHPPG